MSLLLSLLPRVDIFLSCVVENILSSSIRTTGILKHSKATAIVNSSISRAFHVRLLSDPLRWPICLTFSIIGSLAAKLSKPKTTPKRLLPEPKKTRRIPEMLPQIQSRTLTSKHRPCCGLPARLTTRRALGEDTKAVSHGTETNAAEAANAMTEAAANTTSNVTGKTDQAVDATGQNTQEKNSKAVNAANQEAGSTAPAAETKSQDAVRATSQAAAGHRDTAQKIDQTTAAAERATGSTVDKIRSGRPKMSSHDSV